MDFSAPDASHNKTIKHSSGRLNFLLFLLSSGFLVVVLLHNAYSQWQEEQQRFADSLTQTVNNYADQAGLLAQAGLHANKVFTNSHTQQLSAFINKSDPENDELLWQDMLSAFFNITGFFVYSDDGQYQRHYGQLLDRQEISEISKRTQPETGPSGVFSLRYGSRGGYYIFTSFEMDGQNYKLVIRRSYSKLSNIVFQGNFPGFELAIIERISEQISIREFYYADSDAQPDLRADEKQRILARAELAYTPWDIIALPEQQQRQAILWQYLSQPLLTLAIFATLAFLLWSYLRRTEEKSLQLESIRRETERRADKALMSIDEALISTDEYGRINYANPKAAALFRENGSQEYLGLSLRDVWPDSKALWNQDYNSLAANPSQPRDSQHHLVADFGSEQRIFEQSYNPLYNGNTIEGVVWLLRDITESVTATQALTESRSRYKALFEEAGVAHCLLDMSRYQGNLDDLYLINANEAAVTLFQSRDRNQLLGEYRRLIAPNTHEFHKGIERARLLKLTTTEFELRLKTFQGNSLHVWAHLSLRSGSDGLALMTLLDVTERNRIVEETYEREAFWSKVMNAMPDLVYVVEPDAGNKPRLVFKNRSLAEMLGYPANHSTSNNWVSLVDSSETENLTQKLLTLADLKDGETAEFSGRFRHADGSVRMVNFIYTSFSRSRDGQVESIVGTARDVTEDIERQERIIDSERRYRLLAENMTDIIWATDAKLNFNFVSSSVEKTLGYKPDELLRSGVQAVFHRSDIRKLIKTLRQHIKIALRSPTEAAEKNVVIRQDMTASCKSGEEIVIEIRAGLLWNEQGALQGISGIARDVTEARQLERELQLAAEVFENSNEAILITDRSLNIASTNKAFANITGYDPQKIIGQTPDFLISQERHDVDFFEEIGEALVINGYWQGEIFYQRDDGEVRTGWAGVSAIRDGSREVQSLIIIMSDISDRKAIEERIHKLAYFDPLTGLPNRSQLHEQLNIMVEQAKQKQQSAALLFIDLDRFKPINDSMGHPAGDQVLKEVAGRLSHCVKKHDLVCRMGGDEFTVAIGSQLDSEAAADTAVKVGERILHALHQPFKLGQREVFISASIGISVFPNDGDSVIELLKNADMAMYHAKELGRDNVQFFDEKMNQKAVELLELENDLRHALAREELELFFQPQYLSHNATVVGAEALLRWNHRNKGLVSPGVFIPIIEDTGLIIPIGQWVLEQACLKFSAWKQQGIQIERIAVNVSARQFKQLDFIQVVETAINKAGIRPEQLELELTESILIDDLEHTLEVLTALRNIGVHTAIDDFGTGYSSLNYLKQFTVDTLKIDQSFIRNLPDNSDDVQITRTIIAMAHNLGLGVIAEGVETKEQLQFLQQEQCEEVQGFYFSKPLPEAEFLQKLTTTEDYSGNMIDG
ncbi:EAL and GGDEF domain-containing protein [Bacterioplanoides sp.]|uniref:sensor domain-containing protein n=1 Tax=Bacterioplanoides sp. TaxID=2066072 RepID=UPI003B5C74DF